MTDLARFFVDCSDPAHPTVSVNGETAPPLRRASFDWTPGNVPHLYLELMGDGMLTGQGVVVQQLAAAEAPLDDMLCELLDKIDAGTLEQAMLNEMGGFGSGVTTGQAALVVMKRWIRGDHG